MRTTCKGKDVIYNFDKFEALCTLCGERMAPSGVDGGSWVHIDTSPDRVVLNEYKQGEWVRTVLANGVVIRPKQKRPQ